MLQEALIAMSCGAQLVVGGQACLHAAASNLIIVGAAGSGAQFTSVVRAVDSITDSSVDNPYVVLILPGSYVAVDPIVIDQPYVSLVGAGQQATVLRRNTTGNVIRVKASNVTITDLKVIAATGKEDEAAIYYADGPATEILLSNLWLEQEGPGSLVSTGDISPGDTWVLRNVIGKTNATGIRGRHTMLLFDSRIIMYGNAATHTAGHPHVGLWKTGGSSRWWVSDTQVGPKLMWHAVNEDGGTSQYTIDGDDDVIALRDDSADGSRISLRNVDLFARNETATQAGSLVLAVQTTTPTAYVRMWGGYAQSEQPNNDSELRTLSLFPGSIFEKFGNPRLESADDDTFGGPNWGVKDWSTSDDDTGLTDWQSAVHRLDASAGPFTIKLPHAPVKGEMHMFVKVDGSSNVVTIGLNGATLEGRATNPQLHHHYDKLVVQWDGTEWLALP